MTKLLLIFALTSVATTATAAESASSQSGPASQRQAQLNKIHLEQASMHVFRDKDGTKLALEEKPVYVWTNPTRSHVQEGTVYVWMKDGRPEVIATIFTHPDRGQRRLTHEFHSLSRSIIDHTHPLYQWEPKAGIATRPIPGTARVADSAARRALQMRAMSRDFTAHSIRTGDNSRYQLRLLPRPILRYEPSSEKLLDGALFVFATNAGTDPEVVLLIEAVQSDAGPQWEFAACRYSDRNLYVQHKKTEVWSSVRGGANALQHDPDHLYRLLFGQLIPELNAAQN